MHFNLFQFYKVCIQFKKSSLEMCRVRDTSANNIRYIYTSQQIIYKNNLLTKLYQCTFLSDIKFCYLTDNDNLM